MPNDYKLCPKCNNALDNNVFQCPYCGENMGISFGDSGFNQNNLPSNQTKNNNGWTIVFFILFILPLLSIIVFFIIEKLSSLF